jgi:septum formation protein
MPGKKTKVILASSSPRRSELLSIIGVEFDLLPSRVDERFHPDEAPADYTIRLARAKAVEAAKSCDSGLIVGADTAVVLDGKVLGKPDNEQDAKRILRLLSGRWHAVITGLALYEVNTRREVADYEKTLVRFAQLTDKEVEWYVKSGEPLDKAGAYAIQGRGGLFVEEIAGNYHNVVGLPLALLYRLAKQLGYSLI